MRLIFGDRVLLQLGGEKQRADPALSIDQYLSMVYQGMQYGLYPQQTLQGNKEDIAHSFLNYVQGAFYSNGPIFTCMTARLMLFSEARFLFRRFGENGGPGELWAPMDGRNPTKNDLDLLRKPWPNATTGDLLARAIQDVDLAGNFFAIRRGDQIRRLRPDWVTIVAGSGGDPAIGASDLGSNVLGYLYHPGGYQSQKDPIPLTVEQVAHFAPIPDPVASFRGMSWITPVIREVIGDSAMREHKIKFLENGATVNLVVKLGENQPPSATNSTRPAPWSREAFDRWVSVFRTQHEGATNAYRTLYLTGGADVTPVGVDMQQLDFKVIQGHGETRIAAAARVPPIIAGFSEGLDAATYANYGQARRAFADHTIRPLWRNLCGSLATIINVPGGSELWYDDRDIAFLQEDQKDAAVIQQTQATTIGSLITAGYRPDSVVEAVLASDFSKLVGEHTGLYSVQLQPPGLPAANPAPPLGESETEAAPVAPVPANGNGAKAPAPGGGRSMMTMPEGPTASELHLHLPTGMVSVPITVQPAQAPEVTIQGDTIHVQPAEVSLSQPITVQPAEVSVPITVEPAEVNVPITVEQPDLSVPVTVESPSITVQPPDVHVDAPVTVNLPPEQGRTQGVDLIYEGDKIVGTKGPQGVDLIYEGDKIVGTRPRSRRKP